MALIPQDFVQELLGRVDIVEIVGRSVQLKKAGTNYLGLCPFHSEKTPSFTVSPAKQFYHCFGCGAHGTAIGFLIEHVGLSFPDAVRELASQAGMQIPETQHDPEQAQRREAQRSQRRVLLDAMEQANRLYRDQLRKSTRAIAYLKGRGITGRSAARFGLGWAQPDWQGLATVFPNYDADVLVQAGLVVARDAQGNTIEPSALAGRVVERRWDRLRERVTFPIRNTQGELIGFGGRVLDQGEPKYLNSPETALFHKGEELYGLFEGRGAIQRHGQALVVEGYLDVIALAQYGVDNAVATLGTACTAEHVRKLFRHCGQIVFAFDGDAAGRKAATRALEAALPHVGDARSVKFLFLPPEHDPDSFVRALGADAFAREVGRAQPLSLFLLDTVAAGLALDTAEGRTQAIGRARPLFGLLPDSTLKAQMLAELAQRVRTPVDAMGMTLTPATRGVKTSAAADAEPTAAAPWSSRRDAQNRPRSPLPPRAARLRAPAPRHDLTAVRILFLQPSLWHTLSAAQHELLLRRDGATQALLQWLETRLDDHPELTASALWEALRADDLLEQAQDCAPGELLDMEPDALHKHLIGAIGSIEQAWIRQRQQELTQAGLRDDGAAQEYLSLSARLLELSRSLPRV